MRHTSTILAPIVLVLSALAPAPAAAQTGDSATLPRVIPAGAPMSAARPDSSALRSDVARRAVEVFGDSLATVRADAEPSWDMDVRSYETQDRVAHYVEQFTGRSKERITRRLESGTRYEPMIRAKMKAGGLPEDMYYLALVESGFDPHAYSRAAAVGMWQFMTSTGRDMGLRIDWWVDDAAAVAFARRPPPSSSFAGCATSSAPSISLPQRTTEDRAELREGSRALPATSRTCRATTHSSSSRARIT